jgi:hypothetical protein
MVGSSPHIVTQIGSKGLKVIRPKIFPTDGAILSLRVSKGRLDQ